MDRGSHLHAMEYARNKIDKKEVSDERILELAIEAGADECVSKFVQHL